jgi:hypothetical protein
MVKASPDQEDPAPLHGEQLPAISGCGASASGSRVYVQKKEIPRLRRAGYRDSLHATGLKTGQRLETGFRREILCYFGRNIKMSEYVKMP